MQRDLPTSNEACHVLSGRQFQALIRVYSEIFGPIPASVLDKAGKMGNLPKLMGAVDKALRAKEAI
jgi:hypothetical protein